MKNMCRTISYNCSHPKGVPFSDACLMHIYDYWQDLTVTLMFRNVDNLYKKTFYRGLITVF